MRQDEGKPIFFSMRFAIGLSALGSQMIRFRLNRSVEVERRQAKEARAVALTAQIGAPHVEVHAAEVARHYVLERGMSDGFTIDAPCEHETGKAIWRSANHHREVGAQLGGRRHTVDIEAHALGVSFGRAREVGDEAIQIFGRERANADTPGV